MAVDVVTPIDTNLVDVAIQAGGLAGRGCFLPAHTVPQPHSNGRQIFGLTGVRILKTTPLGTSKPSHCVLQTRSNWFSFDKRRQREPQLQVLTACVARNQPCLMGRWVSTERPGPRSSNQLQALLSPHPQAPQSLELASAESAWWPGSPCLVQCCRRGVWAAAERTEANSSPWWSLETGTSFAP